MHRHPLPVTFLSTSGRQAVCGCVERSTSSYTAFVAVVFLGRFLDRTPTMRMMTRATGRLRPTRIVVRRRQRQYPVAPASAARCGCPPQRAASGPWMRRAVYIIMHRRPLPVVADSRTGHQRDGDKDDGPPPTDEDSRPPAAAAIARRTGIRRPLPLSTAAGGERSVDASSGLHHHTPPSVARHGGLPDQTPTRW